MNRWRGGDSVIYQDPWSFDEYLALVLDSNVPVGETTPGIMILLPGGDVRTVHTHSLRTLEDPLTGRRCDDA